MARLNVVNELFYFVIAEQVYFMPVAREVRGFILLYVACTSYPFCISECTTYLPIQPLPPVTTTFFMAQSPQLLELSLKFTAPFTNERAFFHNFVFQIPRKYKNVIWFCTFNFCWRFYWNTSSGKRRFCL